jgi:protoheme IX farnesyltransferase
MTAIPAFAGALLADPHPGGGHIYAVLTTVCLAMGCSALNQYQEHTKDALMERTKNRPIPSGRVYPFTALRLGLFFITVSLGFTLIAGSMPAFFLALVTVQLYNFVYTPLKNRTPFALLIGSVTGAVPPMLGCAVLGGNPFTLPVMTVAGVMYIWQTPHFAALSEKYADDYKKAGFRTLSATYGRQKTRVFISVWLAAFVCALLFVPAVGIYHSYISGYLHLSVTAAVCFLLIFLRERTSAVFHILNNSMLVFFLILAVDRIIL